MQSRLSELMRRAIKATPEERERQAAALKRSQDEAQAEARRNWPYIRVTTNTNLKRADVDNSHWGKIKRVGFNDKVIDMVQAWTPEKQWGLFLWGGVGTGKTHLLKGLMIHWAQKNGTSGLFFSLQDLMNNFREHLDDLEHYKHKLLQTDIMVIDDFGAEKTTEFVQVELLSFIDKRINSGKSLFMSSNHDPPQLKDIYDIRILDRLQALMRFVKCDGESYRRIIAQMNHQDIERGI